MRAMLSMRGYARDVVFLMPICTAHVSWSQAGKILRGSLKWANGETQKITCLVQHKCHTLTRGPSRV